jgi:hypothetical protein
MTFRPFVRFGVVPAVLLVIAGCSRGGLKTIPVYGNVTFVGREAPKTCRLFFKPVKVDGVIRPAATERQSNGSYSVNAFSSSKGLIPGTYRIDVTYYDLAPGKDASDRSNWMPTTYDAGEVVVSADSSGVEHNIEVPLKIK